MILPRDLWLGAADDEAKEAARQKILDRFGPQQLQWLEADLSAASRNAEVDWIVAFAHKPLYCSTNDFNDCGRNNVEYIRPNIEPLFERYGVDLYLTGHVHNYERTWPVLNDTAVSTDPATAYVDSQRMAQAASHTPALHPNPPGTSPNT